MTHTNQSLHSVVGDAVKSLGVATLTCSISEASITPTIEWLNGETPITEGK